MRPLLYKVSRRFTGSVRYKLLALVLFPLLIVIPAVLAVAVWWAERVHYQELLRTVHTDLAVAREAFERSQRDFLSSLRRLGDSWMFRTALRRKDVAKMEGQLAAQRLADGFDFLHVTDLQGRWICSSFGNASGISRGSPLLHKAARRGVPGVGLEIYSREELAREDDTLSRRVALPPADPQHAATNDGDAEQRAMVIRAVYPVRDARGRLVALLDGGVILNRNFSFVDSIRDLVYGPGSLP
ncbi:MAG: hypothetical protein JSW10_11115 [Pseudomonadota bacterium]|nr:MAG: hypothetical protein JSW10_11115 [Pseudomonadota bacterium]